MKKGKGAKTILSIIITFVFHICFLHAGDTVQTRISDLEEKAASVTSYQADLSRTMETMGKRIESKGTFIYKKPNKTRMESEIDMGAMTMKQVLYNDGTTIMIKKMKEK